MIRLAWRSLRARWTAVLAAALAVLVGAALVSAALIVRDSAAGAADAEALSTWRLSEADLVVLPDDTVRTSSGLDLAIPEPPVLSPEALRELRGVSGVAAVDTAAPVPAYLIADGELVGGPERRSWGHPWSTAAAEPFRLGSGRPPRTADEVVLSTQDAARAGAAVGEPVDVLTPGGERRFTLVGTGDWLGSQYEHALFFTRAAADGMGGEPRAALVALAGGQTGTAAARDAIERALPGARVLSGDERDSGLVLDAERRELASGSGRFLTVIAASATLMAVFVISGALLVSVAQRHPEIALLRSIGARPSRVRMLIAAEAALIGLIAGPLGSAAGVGVAAAAVRFFADRGMLPEGLPLSLSPGPFLVATVIAVAASGAAGLLPAWRASHVPPADAMRTTEPRRRRPGLLRAVLGATFVLVGLGVGAAGAAAGAAGGTQAVSAGASLLFLGVPPLLAGAVLLVPTLLKGAVALLAPLRRRLLGPLLASREIQSDPRRAMGVTTPVLLLVAFSCLMVFQDATTFAARSAEFDERLRADRILSGAPQMGLPGGVAERASKVPGVAAVSPIAHTRVVVGSEHGWQTTVNATAVRPDAITEMLHLPAVAGSWRDFGDGDSVAMSAGTARANGWRVGEQVEFLLADGTPEQARLAAVYEADTLPALSVLLPRSLVRPHLLNAFDAGVYVALRPGADRAETAAGLAELAGTVPGGRALSREEFLADQAAQSSGNTWILHLVVAVIAGYAGISAVSVLAGSAVARRSRFALLRLAGARTRTVLSALAWEVAVLAATGIAAGTGVAVLILTGYGYILTGGFVVAFSVPTYLAICGAAAAAVLLGALLPARLAMRTTALEAARAW